MQVSDFADYCSLSGQAAYVSETSQPPRRTVWAALPDADSLLSEPPEWHIPCHLLWQALLMKGAKPMVFRPEAVRQMVFTSRRF